MTTENQTSEELKEKLQALDIEALCQEKSRDEVFEMIRDMCGVAVTGGLAYIFYHFCTEEEILKYVILTVANIPLTNTDARKTLLKINDLIQDFVQYGNTEKYFIRINDSEGIKRLEVKHLVRLRDLLVIHLEALEEVNKK